MSDPANPVPYRKRPIEATYASTGSKWYTWLLQDQRFLDDRRDVLRWVSEPLTEEVVVAGDIVAKLFVSTTGQDADWVVKLIDVSPENDADPVRRGYQLMVANDVFRSRFRESFETPKPMQPNTVTPITIDLHTQSYRFLKGHRIMVQVQSTWFPIIDRNPQTWVPNIFEADRVGLPGADASCLADGGAGVARRDAGGTALRRSGPRRERRSPLALGSNRFSIAVRVRHDPSDSASTPS